MEMSYCESLTIEKRIQRLSADDLLKTKYMKTIMKTPVAILKELLVRYEAWVGSGGTRASMAEPLAWEDEERQECVYQHGFRGFSGLLYCKNIALTILTMTTTKLLGSLIPFVYAPPLGPMD